MANKNRRHQEIWTAFRSGGEEAFSSFFYAFYSSLYNYGLKLVRDEELVKDVIQDFFLYLFENRTSLAEQVELPISYLLASFRRRLLNERNRLKLRHERLEKNDLAMAELFVIGKEDLMIKEESNIRDKAIVLKLLNELPPRQREIIYLKYYHDLSIQDIADVFSISYQVVANHLYRALKKLRNNETTKKIVHSNIRMLFL